jgi:cephalosporin hydroxylase
MSEISGWHAYKNTTTLQHADIASKLRDLFLETKPSQILEIGTSYGGLTVLI